MFQRIIKTVWKTSVGELIHARREPFGKTRTFPVVKRKVLCLQRFECDGRIAVGKLI